LAGYRTRQQQPSHVEARNHRQHGRGSEQHHEEEEEAPLIPFSGRLGEQPCQGPELRDLLRKILAADRAGSRDQGLLRLRSRDPIT
jgi:hypothetical protein